MVYNHALNYVQNIEDAQEIAQDVFVAVHQSLNSFQENSSLSTWMYSITINKRLDFLKSKQRKKRFAFLTSLIFDGDNDLKHNTPEHNHPGILFEHKEGLDNLLKKKMNYPTTKKQL